jgi:hypothetical protein
MAATPEGAVKKKVREYLKSIGAYQFSPVQMGIGSTTLDILCCIGGRFVGIEVKAPGKIPTERQILTIKAIQKANGIAVFGDSIETIKRRVEIALERSLNGQ